MHLHRCCVPGFAINSPCCVWVPWIKHSPPAIWATACWRKGCLWVWSNWRVIIVVYVFHNIFIYWYVISINAFHLKNFSDLPNNTYFYISMSCLGLCNCNDGKHMMTSSNGNISASLARCAGEFTDHRGIPLTKASVPELWCFPSSAPEQTVE